MHTYWPESVPRPNAELSVSAARSLPANARGKHGNRRAAAEISERGVGRPPAEARRRIRKARGTDFSERSAGRWLRDAGDDDADGGLGQIFEDSKTFLQSTLPDKVRFPRSAETENAAAQPITLSMPEPCVPLSAPKHRDSVSTDAGTSPRAAWPAALTDIEATNRAKIDRLVAIFCALTAAFAQSPNEWLPLSHLEMWISAVDRPLSVEDLETIFYYARSNFDVRWIYNKHFYVYDTVEVRKGGSKPGTPSLNAPSPIAHFQRLMLQDLSKFLIEASRAVPLAAPSHTPPSKFVPEIGLKMFTDRKRRVEDPSPAAEPLAAPPFAFARVRLEPPVVNLDVVRENLLMRSVLEPEAARDEAEIEENVRLMQGELGVERSALKAKIAEYVS